MRAVLQFAVVAFGLQTGSTLAAVLNSPTVPPPANSFLLPADVVRGAVPIRGARNFRIQPGYSANCQWINESTAPPRGTYQHSWEVRIETHAAGNAVRVSYEAMRELSPSDDLGPIILQYSADIDSHGVYRRFNFDGLTATRANPNKLRRMSERVRSSDLPDRFRSVFVLPHAGRRVRQDGKLIDDETLLELAGSILGTRHPDLRVRDIENHVRAGGIVHRGSEEYLVVEMLFEIRTTSRRGEVWFRAEGYRLIHLGSGLVSEVDETIMAISSLRDREIHQESRNRMSCDIGRGQTSVARRQVPQVLWREPPSREPPAPRAGQGATSTTLPIEPKEVARLGRWRVQGDPLSNPAAVAVIMGNRSYQKPIPEVDFAHNDADAVKRFVVEVLGYDSANIIDVRDATKAQLEGVFGNERSHQGRLWRYLEPEGGSDVVVFYSGHGVPGLKDKRGYLLPVNGDPDLAEINGYPVDVLYANLAKLSARSITVFLDACFSGETPKGMLIQATSGISIRPKLPTETSKLTVVTAAAGGQVASWDLDAGHGLFTRHLLDALYGAADESPPGNGDGQVTLSETKTYLNRHMTRAARRVYGREQEVTVLGEEGAVLANLSGLSRIATPYEATRAPSREAILEAQRLLSAAGYDPGAIDGLLGPSTQNAIVRYQATQGLTVDGQVSDLLIESLYAQAK